MTNQRKTLLRTKEEWLKIFEIWKQSQQKPTTWCKANGVPHSSFFSAIRRFLPDSNIISESIELNPSSFQELKESKTNIGIEITFKHITILLNHNFDENTLLALLRTLEKL